MGPRQLTSSIIPDGAAYYFPGALFGSSPTKHGRVSLPVDQEGVVLGKRNL